MKKAIYLDNNSTTPLDPRVLDAMLPVLKEHHGNPSSSQHVYGWYAEELVEIAREQVAKLINAAPSEIIFTSGATESTNLAIFGVAAQHSPEHSFLSSVVEHKAVLDPLRALEQKGASVTLLPVDCDGLISLGTLTEEIKHGHQLFSLIHANNEIGSVHSLAEIAAELGKTSTVFHADGTQAVGKIPVDVKQLGVDLYSFSAHKMYGPKGIGALYIREGSGHKALQACIFGGAQEKGLRAGTLNVPGIVGFGKAAELALKDLKRDTERILSLQNLFVSRLEAALGSIAWNGSRSSRIPGNLNLIFEGTDNIRLLGLLATKVACSISSACQSLSKVPSHVLQAIGRSVEQQKSSVRFGIGRFTSEEEISAAVALIVEAVQTMRKA